jgi:hypothetical protein
MLLPFAFWKEFLMQLFLQLDSYTIKTAFLPYSPHYSYYCGLILSLWSVT